MKLDGARRPEGQNRRVDPSLSLARHRQLEHRRAATIAGHILERAAPGSIVLLHDSLFAWEEAAFRDRSACFAAVETLLERLPGYRFVTVSELLRRGAARQRYWVQLPDRADMARLRLAEGSAAP